MQGTELPENKNLFQGGSLSVGVEGQLETSAWSGTHVTVLAGRHCTQLEPKDGTGASS